MILPRYIAFVGILFTWSFLNSMLALVLEYITYWQRPLEQKPTLAYEMLETQGEDEGGVGLEFRSWSGRHFVTSTS